SYPHLPLESTYLWLKRFVKADMLKQQRQPFMKRNVYLEDIPLDEAQAELRRALQESGLWQPLPPETVALTEATGRITAAAVWARLSSPHYHASAMDGYAIRAQDTIGATETYPGRLTMSTHGI